MFTHNNYIPIIGDEEYLNQALLDILAILKKKASTNLPSASYGDMLTNAIVAVAQLLGRTRNKPVLLNPSDTPSQAPRPDPLEEVNKVCEVPRVKPNSIQPEHQLPRVNVRKNHVGTNFKQLALNIMIAKQLFNNQANHIFNDKGVQETIDSLRKKDPEKWNRALSNEWGRLAQGNKYGVQSTNTITFIPKSSIPNNASITYASFVCDYRPLKSEPYRVRIVAA